MNKYELAVVVSANVEDEVRTATIEKVNELITRFGGWKDRHLIDAFVHYSDIVMNHYKGNVRYWLTFNELTLWIWLHTWRWFNRR